MKRKILKISVFVFLLAFMGAGCEKDEDFSYLDETKEFYPLEPGFAIYKTKKDYFFYVPIRPYENSYQSLELNEKNAHITLYKGKYYFNERYRLIDGYVVSSWASPDYYFTSLSFDTYIREKLSPECNQWTTNPKVTQSIIDQDPYVEFYKSDKGLEGKSGFTISDLNQLIKEKNLEKYFKKVK